MVNKKISLGGNSIIPSGVATPYIAIFNSQLSVIRDPKTNRPLGTFVTKFEYTYDEEKVDRGIIEIETDNPDLVDLTELSYGQGLQLQWGYIYPNGNGYYSPVRKVIITSSNIAFSQAGVKLSLEISDSSILLKKAPSNYYDNTKGFVKYIEDLCKGMPIGIALVDYNEQTVIKPKVAQRTISGKEIASKYPQNLNTGAEWATGSPLQDISPEEIVHTPTTVLPDAVGVKLLEWNPDTQALTIKDPDNFRKVYLKEDMMALGLMVGTSRNKYYQLQDICRSLSGGPFFLDSRDGGVVIHNVKSQRKITKVYTYLGGSGELLEFNIKSNYVKTSTEVKQSTEINPDSKSIDTNFVQAIVDPDAGNPDGSRMDTYMAWPNLYVNPNGKPGIVGIAPDSPAWQPTVGEQRHQKQGDPEYHVMTNYTSKDRAVKATEEKPAPPSIKSFRSVKEAQKYYLNHPEQVTQEEIAKYFESWMSDWNSKKSATDPNSLSELAHHLDRIPPMKIIRPVIIKAEVDLETMGGSMGLTKPKDRNGIEAFKNAIESGQVDLNIYNTNRYSTPDGSGIRTSSMVMGGTYRKNAEILLKSIKGISISNPLESSRNRVVTYQFNLEIEMNGVDVVSGADTINLAGTMGNDIVESVTNKVKANAKVIGDPVLESSMNIQVQNISQKYSGLWYTKKVTHTIDVQTGYTCDIEFVQRTVPISTLTLRSNWSKKDYGQIVLGAMKQAKESKSYKKPSKIEKEIKKHLKDVPDSSYIVYIDPLTGSVKEAQKDMVSGNYLTKPDGSTQYGGNIQEYVRDLQKNIEQ